MDVLLTNAGFNSIVIFGCSGYLGQFIWKHISSLLEESSPALIGSYWTNNIYQFSFAKHQSHKVIPLDLRSNTSVDAFLKQIPPGRKLFINAVALSNIKENEANPSLAENLNIPRHLIQSIATNENMKDSFFIHFSTDQSMVHSKVVSYCSVFSGERKDDGMNNYKEEDSPSPLHEYGRTKLTCEQLLKELLPNRHVIFRSSVIFGPPPPLHNKAHMSFVQFLKEDITKVLESGDPEKKLECFSDEYRNFVYVQDILQTIDKVIQLLINGSKIFETHSLFHLGGKEVSTRYELAQLYCKLMGVNQAILKPIKQSELDLGYPR